jgi:hypothetical protein
LSLLDFPVSTQVWGNVADWVAACGTVAAAFIAVGYYIYQSEQARKAQAAQIRPRLYWLDHSHDNGPFYIEVENNSDRPISNVNFVYYEKSLLLALLFRRKEIPIPLRGRPVMYQGKRTVFIQTNSGGPDLAITKSKSDIVGFDRRAAAMNAINSHIGPSSTQRFIKEFETTTYRRTTAYWVIFQDANGNLWQVAPIHGYGEGLPKLRRAKSFSKVVSNALRFRKPWKQKLKEYRKIARYYLKLPLWLYRNRNERTSGIPRWERADWTDEEGPR